MALIVNGPDPENLVIGTIRGGNFYHTVLKKGTFWVHEKSRWTCQSGSLIGENALLRHFISSNAFAKI